MNSLIATRVTLDFDPLKRTVLSHDLTEKKKSLVKRKRREKVQKEQKLLFLLVNPD